MFLLCLLHFMFLLLFDFIVVVLEALQGRIQGGRRTRCAPPPPPKIGKNKIFWRKIVIFHTKHPNNFRASLRSAQFF
jgi:hypothetical protein